MKKFTLAMATASLLLLAACSTNQASVIEPVTDEAMPTDEAIPTDDSAMIDEGVPAEDEATEADTVEGEEMPVIDGVVEVNVVE